MIIADTSVWIDFARDPRAEQCAPLRAAMREGILLLCEPVIAEVLAGLRDHEVERTERVFAAFEVVETQWVDWESAATLKRLAARRGLTIRTLIDCLIAAVAMRTASTVLHRDRDFERIAEVLPLLDQTRG